MFEMDQIMFRPHLDIFGLSGKNQKLKAYTKLTVVMFCQILRSVAPYSGNFCRRLQATARAGDPRLKSDFVLLVWTIGLLFYF